MRSCRACIIAAAALVAPSLAAGVEIVRGAEDQVPPEYQAAILLRAMSFDRNLKQRADGVVDIAVLFAAGNGESERESREIVAGMRLLADYKIGGLPWKVSAWPLREPGSLTALAGAGVDAVYICGGLRASLGEIGKETQEHRILSMAGREEYVRGGLSLGAVPDEGRPRLLVNLASLRREHVELSSDVLSLATVLE